VYLSGGAPQRPVEVVSVTKTGPSRGSRTDGLLGRCIQQRRMRTIYRCFSFVDRVTDELQLERGTQGMLPSRRCHSFRLDCAMSMKPRLPGVFLALALPARIAGHRVLCFTELSYGDSDLGVTTTRLILGAAPPARCISLLGRKFA